MPEPGEISESSAPEQPAAAQDAAGTAGGAGAGTQSEKVANRHDRLFKAGMAVPENAVSLLQEVLSADLLELMDFSRVRRLPTEHISRLLQERRLDVVYEVAMAGGGDMLVHFINDIEVQYSVDELMASTFSPHSPCAEDLCCSQPAAVPLIRFPAFSQKPQ